MSRRWSGMWQCDSREGGRHRLAATGEVDQGAEGNNGAILSRDAKWSAPLYPGALNTSSHRGQMIQRKESRLYSSNYL